MDTFDRSLLEQDRKFAIRSALNIVSAGQRRPRSRGHSPPKCIHRHTPGMKGVHIASHHLYTKPTPTTVSWTEGSVKAFEGGVGEWNWN